MSPEARCGLTYKEAGTAVLDVTIGAHDENDQINYQAIGSGTTFNYTDYLSRVSGGWQSQSGVGKDINWPSAATDIGGKGNAGVANYVTRTKGLIGYVEYAYSTQNHLAYAQLQKPSGAVCKFDGAKFSGCGRRAGMVHQLTTPVAALGDVVIDICDLVFIIKYHK